MRPQISSSLTRSAILQTRKRPPHRYNGWFLGVLCAAYVLSIVALFVAPGGANAYLDPIYSIAMCVYLAVLIIILVTDWRGFLTLHGHADWREMSWPARIGLAVVNLLFWLSIFLVPALYLGFAIKDTYGEWRKRPLLRKLKTAQLEAELGFTPPTEGQCRNCGKPLQVGAEYCQYCGAPALIKPRVCPVCATVAQPDASFCPKCRAPLVAQ